MSTTDQLVAFVRSITDLDEADLPVTLIRQYMKDGYQRIINLERRWPFMETTHTLNTIANQRDYPMRNIGETTPGAQDGNLREIISIMDDSSAGNRLSIVSLDDAEAVWHGAFDTPSRPLLFAEWGDNIKLYPKPDVVYPLTIRGYRKPDYGWVEDGTQQVDCDERLHDAIAYYAVSQVYKRQEDSEMSNVYKQSFDEAVSLARNDLMRPSSHRPMVLSKGAVRPSGKYWLESLGRDMNL